MSENTATLSIRNIDGVDYVTATDAAEFLGVIYNTVLNLTNSRQKYLVAEKIGSTLFVTVESLKAEKVRRDALKAKEVSA